MSPLPAQPFAASSLFDGVRSGTLEVRLARDEQELDAAQALRYQVFYEELGAKADASTAARRRDADRFDDICDHLIVIDHARGEGPEKIVATYRLLRRSVAERHGGFYSATEFDISPLLAQPGEILELGRSCVAEAYRNRPTMQLLWRGIATYVFRRNITIMFGCASLPGVNPQALAVPLSFLYHYHLAPPNLRVRALPERYVRMDLIPKQDVDTDAAVAVLAQRAALAALPPLIKGYLRLGGLIGDGAVIDPQFNTTDVCVIVVTDRLTEKYLNHYRRGMGDLDLPTT